MIRSLCLIAALTATTPALAKPPPKKAPTQAEQIAALWQRIDQLEQTLNLVRSQTALLNGHDNAVKAPFIVTDEKGRAILEVVASEEGAAIRFNSLKAELGTVTIDGRGFSFTTASHKTVARLGGSEDGGQLLLGGASGAVNASLSGLDGEPSLHLLAIASLSKRGLQILNENGKGTAAVLGTQSDGGGGLQLSTGKGSVAMEAGSDYDGRGFIHAGPIYRCFAMAGPTAMAGAVPDCIRGKLE